MQASALGQVRVVGDEDGRVFGVMSVANLLRMVCSWPIEPVDVRGPHPDAELGGDSAVRRRYGKGLKGKDLGLAQQYVVIGSCNLGPEVATLEGVFVLRGSQRNASGRDPGHVFENGELAVLVTADLPLLCSVRGLKIVVLPFDTYLSAIGIRNVLTVVDVPVEGAVPDHVVAVSVALVEMSHPFPRGQQLARRCCSWAQRSVSGCLNIVVGILLGKGGACHGGPDRASAASRLSTVFRCFIG